MSFLKRLSNHLCRRNNKLQKCCNNCACGTGNQCLYYNDFEVLGQPGVIDRCYYDLGDGIIVPYILPPWNNHEQGWTRISCAADVEFIGSRSTVLTNFRFGFESGEGSITMDPRIIRYRRIDISELPGLVGFGFDLINIWAANPANQDILVSVFGPTTVPGDSWKYAELIARDFNEGPVAIYFVDYGAVSGTVTASRSNLNDPEPISGTLTMDNLSVLQVQQLLSDNISFLHPDIISRFNHLLNFSPLYNPLGTDDLAPSESVRSGPVWIGPAERDSGTTIDSLMIKPWFVPMPIDDADGIVDTLEPDSPVSIGRCPTYERFRRGGASFRRMELTSDGGGGITVILNVDWSFDSHFAYSMSNSVNPDGQFNHVISDDIDVRAKLISDRSNCPEYSTLPENVCDKPIPMRIAVGCIDETMRIVFDPISRPPYPLGRTILYDGVRYSPTPEQTLEPSVEVTWSPDDCEPDGPDGEFAIANICRPFPGAPPSIVYQINTSVGAGNGAVNLVTTADNPACPGTGKSCTSIIRYQPTDSITDGPSTPGSIHLSGTPCIQTNTTVCTPCGPSDPSLPGGPPIVAPRPSSAINTETMTERFNRLLKEQEFDVNTERTSLRSGGCCSPPTDI